MTMQVKCRRSSSVTKLATDNDLRGLTCIEVVATCKLINITLVL